jgi:hypothetical protein
MSLKLLFSFVSALLTASLCAEIVVDEAKLGKSLGGWKKRDGDAAEYPLSGATYRTYRPEITPTPDGGIFISIRIDHVRGWLSTDDHATLEVAVDRLGKLVSAQSNIAIQGRSITSDVIRGGTDAGLRLAAPDRAVQIGTDLVADLSAKLLREKIVEAGRVSFPAVLRHNYNLLYQAIQLKEKKGVQVAEKEEEKPVEKEIPITKPVETEPKAEEDKKLEIKSYGGNEVPKLPVENKEQP